MSRQKPLSGEAEVIFARLAAEHPYAPIPEGSLVWHHLRAFAEVSAFGAGLRRAAERDLTRLGLLRSKS